MLLLLLIKPGQNRGKPNFPRFKESISQERLKLLHQKIVFDFTVGRLSENVKILLRRNYDFVCNKGAQGGSPQKRSICHICIFDH